MGPALTVRKANGVEAGDTDYGSDANTEMVGMDGDNGPG